MTQQLCFAGIERQKDVLDQEHYLGSAGSRAFLRYEDNHGIILFSNPSSRRLPHEWLELSRWCLRENGHGSQQWRACVKWLGEHSEATTVVSYSDPSVGHTGALYRACNFIWAPTWHVLREPPTGMGTRGGKKQRAKHRWVCLLRPDHARESLLAVNDDALMRRYPWASYQEPRWKRGVPQIAGMNRFRIWTALNDK